MFEAIWIGFAFAIHRGQSQNQTRSLQTYCRDTKYGRNNYLVKLSYTDHLMNRLSANQTLKQTNKSDHRADRFFIRL